MYNEEINTLIHAGKKGMKWGVRKDRSIDYTSSRTIGSKIPSKLSNEELKKVITRMQLERQYKDINPIGAKSITGSLSSGNKAVLAILAVGTTINSAIAFSNSAAGARIKATIVERLSN
jgi:hypothetical protein